MDGGLDFPSADIALQHKAGQVEHVPLHRARKQLLKLVYSFLQLDFTLQCLLFFFFFTFYTCLCNFVSTYPIDFLQQL